MTTIKFKSGLLGKEDINWGDASTTFSRETPTGGSISISYIDDSVIPASSLGGYIDDNLHEQNTDTGTTSSTFDIASGGNRARLSNSGLSADRTYTFPDSSDQQLTGATDLASTAASKGASLVGIQDSGSYFSSATVEAAMQELGSDVSVLEAGTHIRGMKHGLVLSYSSSTAINIGGGMWALTGTTNRHVTLSAQTTFTLGSAGSNSSSTDLGASQIHYIYLDDSAIEAADSNALTASEFINTTTAPSYNHAKAGWYNGNDRCIGAVLTDSSNAIVEFYIKGKHYYQYAAPVLEYTTAAAGVTYASLDLSSSVPGFSTMARLRVSDLGAAAQYYFDTAATATTPEAHYAAVSAENTWDIPTDASQAVYWYADSVADTMINTSGYYLDEL